ncbi:MAG: response regulator transcription factor, partial [Steroidobacteraceae bacterium]|nr:response regulator transcription factor [Steroidobacteraceae bacterium]
MRLLLIDHDPRYRALLRHHVTCRWPDAEIVTYNPVRRGRLAPEFLAQGFDAVLLDHDSPCGAGYGWLEELGARAGFAPVLFFAPDDAAATRERAIEAGAF